MKKRLKILTYLTALLSIATLLKPTDTSTKVFFWVPKLLGAALSPILGLISGLGALSGLIRGDWKLAGIGILGAGMAAKLLNDIPNSEEQFEAVFSPKWRERVPNRLRSSSPILPRSIDSSTKNRVEFQRSVICEHPNIEKALLADLWQPTPGSSRSGLGVINLHGGGWRVGDKGLGTQHFFHHLAGQGHVVLDVAYTLWPQADIQSMVTEANQAIIWMKDNHEALSVNPERIFLMGGSAGAHLALLAAYTADQKIFLPEGDSGETSVRGVIAFYPPVDLLNLQSAIWDTVNKKKKPIDQAVNDMMNFLFMYHPEGDDGDMSDMLTEMMGGSPDEIPDTYRALSPIYQVGPHCPPTLLLHGSDDVFGLTPGVRRLHKELQAAGVPAVLVEYPHTDHGFDLVLPQISPVARSAAHNIERFLALS
jgi:acetyl esterase/lipase